MNPLTAIGCMIILLFPLGFFALLLFSLVAGFLGFGQ